MTRLILLLLSVLALAVGVAACGGDDDDSGGQAAAEDTTAGGDSMEGSTLTLTADPSGALAFDKTELSAPAGEITIMLVNDSGVPHNVEIEGQDAVTDTIAEGSAELTVTLEPGEYVFFCNLPGHRAAGMEGTLTVG